MPDDVRIRVPSLMGYNVEANRHSVSGLSSGAFMAVQLHLAHSSSFVGAGVIAGGPYRCAETFRDAAIFAGDACALTALYIAMAPLTPAVAPKPLELAAAACDVAKAGKIDPLTNLKNDRIYIFTGTQDRVLSPIAVRGTRKFYEALGVREENIRFVDNIPAGHSIITSNPEDLPLGANQPPYLNYGGEDFGGRMQSHDVLKHIYPDLQPPAEQLSGQLLRFDQRPFVDGDFAQSSMNPYGYVYVPGSVLHGGKARAVHIALHGCKQGCGYVTATYGRPDTQSQPPYGNRFITTTGYNSIADSNDIIVLYPQAIGSDLGAQNPEGCWDWWGYTDAGSAQPDYYTQNAIQIRAIHRMLAQLCSGGEEPAIRMPAPAAKVMS